MFFSGVNKHLPHLSRYLNVAVSRQPSRSGKVAAFGAVMGVGAGVIGGVVGLLAGTGLLAMSTAEAAVGVVLLNAGVWASILAYGSHHRKKELATPDYRLFEEARQVAKDMHSSLTRRRLHRELHPGVAELLEESARNWCRTMGALETPFWQNPDLAAHWRAIRDQAAYASNQAMAELLVLLKSAYEPNPNRNAFTDVVEDAIETYVTGPQGPRTPDLMPVAFQQAREIAEKLKLVASEVERATHDVSKEDSEVPGLRSQSALDLALHDIRSVREAENELRQNLGG
jgi:hypothetical protein